MKRFIVIFILLIGHLSLFAGKIERIKFEGLHRTNETWLLAQLQCELGTYLDSEIFHQDLQYIKDLNLFLKVEGFINTLQSGDFEIIFKVKESLYFYPILTWKRASDRYKIQLGGSYDHLFGMKGKIGGIIEYYDKFSFVFYHDLPLHINQKTGHYFSFSKRATVEPVVQEASTHTIDFDLYTIGGGVYYHWKPRLVSKFGLQYFKESYYTDFSGSPIYNEGQAITFNKIQIAKGLTIDRRHYHEDLLSGYAFELEGEYIKTFEFKGDDGNFVKIYGTYRYFTSIDKKKDNVALKLYIGLSSNGNIPLPPFVLDNFINLRGVGDRSVRGTGVLGMNIEYRRRILLHDYFYLQAVLFSDIASIRPRLANVSELFNSENVSSGNGLGLRVQLRKFYHTILSIDYSIPALNKGGKGGLVLGIGQFF